MQCFPVLHGCFSAAHAPNVFKEVIRAETLIDHGKAAYRGPESYTAYERSGSLSNGLQARSEIKVLHASCMSPITCVGMLELRHAVSASGLLFAIGGMKTWVGFSGL